MYRPSSTHCYACYAQFLYLYYCQCLCVACGMWHGECWRGTCLRFICCHHKHKHKNKHKHQARYVWWAYKQTFAITMTSHPHWANTWGHKLTQARSSLRRPNQIEAPKSNNNTINTNYTNIKNNNNNKDAKTTPKLLPESPASHRTTRRAK